MYSTLKRIFVGRPIPSSEEHHQRLSKVIALAVFASDAISSTAYATEEILLVLVPVAGMAALNDLVPISLVVVVLLAIVTTSYRQTLFAYPNGGGSYIVSRENLGVTPALVAGASLLVDYVLTVAVSVSAGVAAITSAFPSTQSARVPMCIFFIALMTVGNLRGVKESGRLFAGPTYIYVFALVTLIVVGLSRSFFGHLEPLPVNQESLNEITDNGALITGVTVFALLRAFSSGAVALSGVEAISNGVPAFRSPEPRNAARTLIWMATILGSTFFGISVLAHRLRPTVSEHETLLSIMGKAVFGSGTFFYFLLQFSTFAILILAANTAYADFPRLSSIIARDGFLPRQLANRGDRLVFSNGVLVLAGVATLLIVVFGGKTSALIPLYAVGVFTGFTLSQTGMVVHHHRLREPRWQSKAVDQRSGRGRDRHRAHGRRRVEVHDRRVDPRRPDPDHRDWAQGDRAPLQARRGRDGDRARVEAAAVHAQRRRARRSPEQADAPGADVRALLGTRPPGRGLGGRFRRGAAGDPEGRGTKRRRRSSSSSCIRPIASSPAPSSATSTSSTPRTPTRSSPS